MTRVIDVLRQVAPKASQSYLAAFDSGDSLLQQHHITTPNRLAHFLAQVLHESGGLMLEHENLKYTSRRLLQIFGVGRHSAAITPAEAQHLARNEQAIGERVYGLGNPRKAQVLGNKDPGNGFKYRGGGLMQTTGRCNYRRMSQICGVDFEGNPDLVFSPEHALKPALAEWTEAGLNVYADNNDILAISRAINCGSPKSRVIPNGMQDRANWFAKVRPLVDRVDFVTDTATSIQSPVAQAPGEFRTELVPQCAIADLLGERILRVGYQGPIVRAVQLALAQLGYPLRGSASFSGRTLRAVKDFQKAHGLEVDGEIGNETANAIDRALAERNSTIATSAFTISGLIGRRMLRVGDAGPMVQAVQLGLARLGYPLKGTGNFGPATEKAVRDFQTQHALEVDGEVGPEVADAVDRALDALTRDAEPLPRTDPSHPQPAAEIRTPMPQLAAAVSLADLVGDGVLGLGDQGPAVNAVQLELRKLGYELKNTGYFAGSTEAAVMDFQEHCGLEVDGEVGPETTRAIDQAVARPLQSTERSQGEQPSQPPAARDMRPLWVIEGLKWLSLREGRGSADNLEILLWARHEGGAIAKTHKNDEIPWCALFANMVLTKIGIKGTETLWALDWDKWGQKLSGPAVGAFAPMKRKGGGHIAIVVGRNKRGNLMCLGGNQNDTVSIVPFPPNRPLSFRWPAGVPLPLKAGLNSLPEMKSDAPVSTKES
ncbi:TIGR02594 family protein [Bradyrhizobium sp. BRP22]|uniref:TIGR02594 family protein n=1 Tax=Bradyrhizobium sp. BRP22 TaxID=2793821 RepID=UPI001CD54A9A|nr:TIGR02594 family protein [Bradyrhizobium sp. BRP22]MCA1458776.1 TIGR02594 family protein [Bradyrhizobium sp. BRP22]